MSTAIELNAIGPGSAGILMSAEEFDSIAEFAEGYCYELVHGVLVVTPIPSEMEASPNEALGGLLFVYHEQHPLGAALDSGLLPERYIVTCESRRRANRVIWAGLGRRPDPRSEIPAIAVEFSPGRQTQLVPRLRCQASRISRVSPGWPSTGSSTDSAGP